MKRVSVVTICFNDLHGLRKTVKSVLSQRRDLFEYVIVDGNSKDGSVEYLESIRLDIDVLVTEPDKGIYDALNKGWQRSSGDFVIFMNSGDTFFCAYTIEKVIPYLTDEVDLAYGDACLMGGLDLGKVKRHPDKMSGFWLIRDVVAHQSQFISRSLLAKNGGYDLEFSIASDYNFLAKVFWTQNVVFSRIPFVVCNFNTEGLSSSPRSRATVENERHQIHMKYAPFWVRFIYYTYAKLNKWIGR